MIKELNYYRVTCDAAAGCSSLINLAAEDVEHLYRTLTDPKLHLGWTVCAGDSTLCPKHRDAEVAP